MMRLRPLDADGVRRYVDELRPRFVLVRVRADRVRFDWAVPLSPFEEILTFVLGAAMLLPWLAPMMPERARAALPALTTGAGKPTPSHDLIEHFDALAGGALRDLLRIPNGEPYVSVRAAGATIDVVAL